MAGKPQYSPEWARRQFRDIDWLFENSGITPEVRDRTRKAVEQKLEEAYAARIKKEKRGKKVR